MRAKFWLEGGVPSSPAGGRRTARSLLLRYTIVVATVALALLVKLLLDPLVEEESPFLLFFAAVMVGAWFGGLAGGLLATVLAAFAADYFFLSPYHSFVISSSGEELRLSLFVFEGLFISFLVSKISAARRQAEARTLQSERDQEELRRSEERFRLLVEGVKDYAIFMLDPEGRVASWNEGARRINGYRREEILGRHLSIFYPKEDVERGEPERELELAEREGAHEEEGWRVRQDGTRFWANVFTTVLKDEAGDLRGFSQVTRDITERREVEEAMRKSEARLRLAVESAEFGTWDYYPATGMLSWDERCKAMFGLPPEAEVDYGTFLERLHPEDRERTDQIVRRALDPESGGRYEAEFRTLGVGGGLERWIAARGQAFFDESGRAVRFIGTALDVTGSKEAEAERELLLAREKEARAEAVAARKRLALLAEAGPVLSSSLDYAATLEHITRLVVPELADWCLVDIVEEDGSPGRFAAAHADPEKEGLLRELGEHRALVAHVSPERRHIYSPALGASGPVLLPEVDGEALFEGPVDATCTELLRGLGPRSCICAPLRARGRTLGTLMLVSAREDLHYGEEDLSLAESLAYRCALAVDNARLYRGRSEIARALQGSLLPSRLPEIPGVEVGLRYLPAGEVDVGGDFYDLFEDAERPGSAWGVAIGDVSGKGAEAAAVLALARYTIRAVSMHERRPSAVLSGLNESMLRRRREREDHRFCTVVCARLERDNANEEPGVRVTVSRGGHPAPVLLRADGSTREIGCPGRVIGVFDDAGLGESEVRLEPGDALVFYTDGVVEARSPDGAFFGEERLVSLLRSCAGLNAQSIADRVEAAVLEFQENGPRDDVAVLALRVPL